MDRGLNTRCLHLEETEGTVNNYGAISFPIYQTATYAHPEVGQSTGYDYSRFQTDRQIFRLRKKEKQKEKVLLKAPFQLFYFI